MPWKWRNRRKFNHPLRRSMLDRRYPPPIAVVRVSSTNVCFAAVSVTRYDELGVRFATFLISP